MTAPPMTAPRGNPKQGRIARSGQSTVEYMLYVSVVVIGIVAIGWIAFGAGFQEGFTELVVNSGTVLSDPGDATNDRR